MTPPYMSLQTAEVQFPGRSSLKTYQEIVMLHPVHEVLQGSGVQLGATSEGAVEATNCPYIVLYK